MFSSDPLFSDGNTARNIEVLSNPPQKKSHCTTQEKRLNPTKAQPIFISIPLVFLTRRSVKINSSRRYRRVWWKSNPKIYRRQFRRRSARFADCQTHLGFRQRLPVSTVLLLATALIKNSDKDTHMLTCLNASIDCAKLKPVLG